MDTVIFKWPSTTNTNNYTYSSHKIMQKNGDFRPKLGVFNQKPYKFVPFCAHLFNLINKSFATDYFWSIVAIGSLLQACNAVNVFKIWIGREKKRKTNILFLPHSHISNTQHRRPYHWPIALSSNLASQFKVSII